MQKKVTNFIVVGAALEDISFDQILDQSREFIEGPIDDAVWYPIVCYAVQKTVVGFIRLERAFRVRRRPAPSRETKRKQLL